MPDHDIPPALHPESLVHRFWAKVLKGPDCWLWTGTPKSRYGLIGTTSGNKLGHRISWELHFGPIPTGLEVCHKCDVKRCVRPDHLFLGTRLENQRDMVRKGRSASGERNAARLYPERLARGEANGNAKLTEDQVRAIRARFDTGELSKAALARELGLDRTQVSDIVRRRTWRHLR